MSEQDTTPDRTPAAPVPTPAPVTRPPEAAEAGGHHPHNPFWTLTLGSIGVVYGDIGTSPIYAMRETLLQLGHAPRPNEIIGVVSLLLWSLIIVVTLKYVALLLRADNHGEGGTLSLMALAQTVVSKGGPVITGLGIAGAALFYGDSILTPAISVLSAVEGLKVVAPQVEHYVLPITLGIIIALYAAQKHGTGRVAALFGPMMLVWFSVLGALGIYHIFDAPQIMSAFNPLNAVRFFREDGFIGFLVLGSVFLAVTGAEALYADMGHFGRGPIRVAWLAFVLPCLTLNYLGQGAVALTEPHAIENLFFLTAPDWFRLPLVLLATAATVIASQAVITGAYSLTRQAMQLGLLPPLAVEHTSDVQRGQIYMPKVNWLMLAGVVVLVVVFKSSGSLAGAYGIAVTATMAVDTLLAVVVVARVWRWGLPLALLALTPFFIVDISYFSANLLKLFHGGYIPLIVGGAVALGMWTWIRGTRLVAEKVRRDSVPLASFVRSMAKSSVTRVPGTAVFLTSTPEMTPSALLHNLKHNRVLHEQNVFLTVHTAQTPYVDDASRVAVYRFSKDFVFLEVTYGFMEEPNVPKALAKAKSAGLKFDIMSTSFFIGRRSLRAGDRAGGMPAWQDAIFLTLMRQADDPVEYFRIPANRVVEMGAQMVV